MEKKCGPRKSKKNPNVYLRNEIVDILTKDYGMTTKDLKSIKMEKLCELLKNEKVKRTKHHSSKMSKQSSDANVFELFKSHFNEFRFVNKYIRDNSSNNAIEKNGKLLGENLGKFSKLPPKLRDDVISKFVEKLMKNFPDINAIIKEQET
jgi:hypothetical protein